MGAHHRQVLTLRRGLGHQHAHYTQSGCMQIRRLLFIKIRLPNPAEALGLRELALRWIRAVA